MLLQGIAMIQCILLLTLSMLLYIIISYPSEPNPPCWWTVFTFSKYSLGKSYERSGSTQQCRYGVIYWMTNNVDIAKHWHLLIKYSQLFTKVNIKFSVTLLSCYSIRTHTTPNTAFTQHFVQNTIFHAFQKCYSEIQ